MSLMDPLADALTNIRNNELQVNDSCVISPASKLIGQVLSTMQKENYIGNFEYIDDNRAGKFIVELEGNINKCGVIKPRHAVKKDEFEKSLFGAVISTALIEELSFVGSALIFCVGINLVREKTFQVANMLPALLVPVCWDIWKAFFS